MKKILTSVFVIALVAGAAFAGTQAFFSDTEESTGNVLAAGAIDLQIDNESYFGGLVCAPSGDNGNTWQIPTGGTQPTDPYYLGLLNEPCTTSWELSDLDGHLFFNFLDIKPGDWGEDTISFHVNNNDSWLCAEVTLTENNENVAVEPELDEEDVDDSDNINADLFDGELAEEIEFIWWADDGDNVLEDDEELLLSSPVNLGDAPQGSPVQVTLADSDNNIWTGAPNDPFIGSDPEDPEIFYIGKAWCFGGFDEGSLNNRPTQEQVGLDGNPGQQGNGILCDGSQVVGNKAQTDIAKMDIAFTATQSRNNAEFLCQRP